MRPKKPTHVLIDQVRITREGNDAIIDHADANLSGARITGIATMTDAEIVEMYNQILDSQWALLEAWDKTVVEEPPGEKQIDYHEESGQWVPRGDVTWLVVSKHLGADSLARWMASERGWSVERIVSRVSYRILEIRP